MGKIREQVLGIVRTSPEFSASIVATGGVAGIQSYDATANRYVPDYTLTPLTLDPEIGIIDPDVAFGNVDGRSYLANIRWYEVGADGTMTEIAMNGTVSTPAGYTVVDRTEGSPTAGRLQMGKNAAPGSPIRLRFTAKCVYNSDTFDIVKDVTVECRDRTPAVTCSLDVPDIVTYNPIHDAKKLPMRLTVLENNQPCPASHFIPVWETREKDGTWREYGTEPCLDYWLDIAADKMSAELSMDHMGYGCSVRVRLKYDRNGSPGSVTLAQDDLSVPFCRFECSRTLGDYRHELVKRATPLGAWVEELRVRVQFKDNMGDIEDPDEYFAVTVYACAPNKTLAASDKVGEGSSVQVPTSKGGGTGLKLGYSVDEYTPLLPLAVEANGTTGILCVDNRPLIVKTKES